MSEQTPAREWLLTDTPTSRRHAKLAAIYQGLVVVSWKHHGDGGPMDIDPVGS
jgi:hypothetical protein